jgi:putative methionine-R-sulfoxide reductase with GAF domain
MPFLDYQILWQWLRCGAGQETNFITNTTKIVGINGEPTALSEILKGNIRATVNIRAEEFAEKTAKLAYKAARGESLPAHYHFTPELVTRENVAEVSIIKLDAISSIPTRLVGINRKTEESRLLQYELTSSINQKMAVLRDKSELVLSITELIRINYEYDRVYLYSLSNDEQTFVLENPQGVQEDLWLRSVHAKSILREVYQKGEAIFVADVHFSSSKFFQEPRWKEMRSRVVLPVRFGDKSMGILDLQSDQPKMHLRNELIGLQMVADQIGVALHNAGAVRGSDSGKGSSRKSQPAQDALAGECEP